MGRCVVHAVRRNHQFWTQVPHHASGARAPVVHTSSRGPIASRLDAHPADKLLPRAWACAGDRAGHRAHQRMPVLRRAGARRPLPDAPPSRCRVPARRAKAARRPVELPPAHAHAVIPAAPSAQPRAGVAAACVRALVLACARSLASPPRVPRVAGRTLGPPAQHVRRWDDDSRRGARRANAPFARPFHSLTRACASACACVRVCVRACVRWRAR
jgi:hypothetical protein